MPRMRPLRTALVFLFTLTLHAQNIDTKSVDALMLRTLKDWKIPGAAIAIVKDDRIVYVQGYGTKDVAGTDKVTADTLFQIASTSKAFTSTALAILADEGKLSFDDRVREHLDYFRLADDCADANVTLRDIVSHRTGVSRHDELWDNSPYSREDVVRRIGAIAPSKPFRTTYQYQNIMFIAAGEVVTKVSGMSWDDFVRTRLFQPLGMIRTVTSDADWNASANRATGHSYDWRTGVVTPQKPIDTTTIGAGGAIKSSARDMANWIRFQLADGKFEGKQLLDPAPLAETKTPETVIRMSELSRERNPETNVMSYAMGWNVQDYRGELLVAHSGSLNGFRTHVDLLPKQKAGFVLLINVGRGVALIGLRNAIADMLLGKPAKDWSPIYLASERKEDEKSAKDREEQMAKRAPDTRPALPLDAYTGEWKNAAYGTATVSLINGKLVLQWNRMTLPLEHFHYDVFTAYSEPDSVDEQVAFRFRDDHTLQSMTIFGETFIR
jgi:CubicO group peptidase (beta-lactamase class C family)